MDEYCAFEDCDDYAKVKGLCNIHYKQQWRGSDLTTRYPRLQVLGSTKRYTRSGA